MLNEVKLIHKSVCILLTLQTYFKNIKLKNKCKVNNMNDKVRKIIEKAKENDGLIRTSDIEKLGISRTYICDLVKSGFLVHESWGLYSINEEIPDEYIVIQKRSNKLIFSYATALFLHGLSDRVSRITDITVPQGYNVNKLKKSYDNLRFHYVKPDLLLEGTESIITPQGFKVTVYNKERCICDRSRAEKYFDKQIYIQVLQDYFKNYFNQRELIRMSKLFKVEKEIRRYMEVLCQ